MVRVILTLFIAAAIAVLVGFFMKGKFDFIPLENLSFEKKSKFEQKIEEKQPEKQAKQAVRSSGNNAKEAEIYFVKTKAENEEPEIYVVKKKASNPKEKLEIAIKTLIEGPSSIDRVKGAYSAIPKETKILGIKEDANSYTINLSDDFEYGGGTTSMSARLKQLTKTALNASGGKDVYLEINGERVESLGGEGINVNQPLKEE